MKTTGIVLLVIAVLAFLVGFSMDTTVAIEFGRQRVHNVGLMNEKQNIILFAGALAVVGAIFVGFAGKAVKPTYTAESFGDTRKCPYCAEQIKREAMICRFCGRELPREDPLIDVVANTKKYLEPNEEEMIKYGITFDGERYHYGEYRYDKYEHALAYAKLQESKRLA